MEYRFLTENSNDLDLIENIYEEAFPQNERIPFHYLSTIYENKNELIAFYHHHILCGFISICTYESISNIVYFAIKKEYRYQGFGSQILEKVKEIKKDHLIMVDIEKIDESQDNNDIRKKRKQFYIKNGFIENNVYRIWNDEEYEVLSYNGHIKKDDYDDFWKQYFNDF